MKTQIKTTVTTNWPTEQEFKTNETLLNKVLTQKVKPYIKKGILPQDANITLHISSTEDYALNTLVILFKTDHDLYENELEKIKCLEDDLATMLDLSSSVSFHLYSTRYPNDTYQFIATYTAIEEF